MVDGSEVPDQAAFDRVVGGLIRSAVSGGGPVRAYGEMVALLWDTPAAGHGAMRTFAFSAEAPAEARHFAVAALDRWDAGDLWDDVALIVTELAANAIVHAHSGFTVTMSAPGDAIRISVRDSRPLPAGVTEALPTAQMHGLGAVNALASRWGVESLGPAGKAIWVELRR